MTGHPLGDISNTVSITSDLQEPQQQIPDLAPDVQPCESSEVARLKDFLKACALSKIRSSQSQVVGVQKKSKKIVVSTVERW